MVSATEINRNISPHYATSRDFLITAVLGSPFCHSTRFQRVTNVLGSPFCHSTRFQRVTKIVLED